MLTLLKSAKLVKLRTVLKQQRTLRPQKRTKPMRQPRYDALYFEGVAWLEALAFDNNALKEADNR